MGDQGGQAAPANGTPVSGEPLPPNLLSNSARAQQRIRSHRSGTLDELLKSDDAAAAIKIKAGTDGKAKIEDGAKTASKQEAKPESKDDHEDLLESDVEAAAPVDEVADEPEPDTEQAKRLASIAAQEKRSRDKVAADRAALAKERAELEKDRAARDAERAEYDAWKKAKARAKIDPVAYLKAGGVEDLDYAAKVAYAEAHAATKPENREAAARLQREREIGDTTSEALERVKQLEAKLERRDQESQLAEHRSTYLDHALKSVDDKTPLAKRLAEKNPAKLRAALWATAEELFEANDGDFPDHAEVLAHYEKTRRAEFSEFGFDVPTAETKKNSQPADKKHPAKTLGNDLATPRVPRPKQGEREHRAETLDMLERGSLE